MSHFVFKWILIWYFACLTRQSFQSKSLCSITGDLNPFKSVWALSSCWILWFSSHCSSWLSETSARKEETEKQLPNTTWWVSYSYFINICLSVFISFTHYFDPAQDSQPGFTGSSSSSSPPETHESSEHPWQWWTLITFWVMSWRWCVCFGARHVTCCHISALNHHVKHAQQ